MPNIATNHAIICYAKSGKISKMQLYNSNPPIYNQDQFASHEYVIALPRVAVFLHTFLLLCSSAFFLSGKMTGENDL